MREIISDDDNGTAYWRYGELYGLQPGMGAAGDLAGDFKFEFGGAVYRDGVHAVRGYGIEIEGPRLRAGGNQATGSQRRILTIPSAGGQLFGRAL